MGTINCINIDFTFNCGEGKEHIAVGCCRYLWSVTHFIMWVICFIFVWHNVFTYWKIEYYSWFYYVQTCSLLFATVRYCLPLFVSFLFLFALHPRQDCKKNILGFPARSRHFLAWKMSKISRYLTGSFSTSNISSAAREMIDAGYKVQ